jgi:anti-sigma-K factor RskA
VDCLERKDLILLYAAGVLDADESAELRQHLAGGCAQCAGYLAEAEAILAKLPLALPPEEAPAGLKQAILRRTAGEPRRINVPVPATRMSWDRIVLPSAIAAVLAAAVTLFAVNRFLPSQKIAPNVDQQTLTSLEAELLQSQNEVNDLRRAFGEMKFAQLTGPAQPDAIGRVFLDFQNSKWYFFASGMKPAEEGKTYELWLICANQKIPAGTFNVGEHGTATLLGAVPTLPAGQSVSLCVTDEPAGGSNSPTGTAQIKGIVE